MKITIDLSERTYSRILHSEIIPDDLNAKVARGILNGKIEEQPRTGHWIDEGQYAEGHSHHAYECSECGNHIIELKPDDFCKFCGADMRESDNKC